MWGSGSLSNYLPGAGTSFTVLSNSACLLPVLLTQHGVSGALLHVVPPAARSFGTVEAGDEQPPHGARLACLSGDLPLRLRKSLVLLHMIAFNCVGLALAVVFQTVTLDPSNGAAEGSAAATTTSPPLSRWLAVVVLLVAWALANVSMQARPGAPAALCLFVTLRLSSMQVAPSTPGAGWAPAPAPALCACLAGIAGASFLTAWLQVLCPLEYEPPRWHVPWWLMPWLPSFCILLVLFSLGNIPPSESHSRRCQWDRGCAEALYQMRACSYQRLVRHPSHVTDWAGSGNARHM